MTATTPRRLDLRLAVPAASAWVTAAVLSTASLRTVLWVVWPAALVLLAALPRRRFVVAALAVGVVVGAAATGVHRAGLERGPVAALAARQGVVELRVHLVRDPLRVMSSAGRPMTVVDVTVDAVRAGAGAPWLPDHAPVTVFAVAGQWLGLLPGQRADVTAKLRPPRGGDVVAAVAFVSESPRLLGRPPLAQRLAGRVRDGLRSAVDGLPGDERGLLPGLTLGDTSAMPAALTDDFRVTGLTHLTAVSGANVAIVLAAVLAATRRLVPGRVGRRLVAGAALAGFVVLVRPSPSVLRAAVMGAVVLVAAMLGRRSVAVPVLSAAVLLLVAVDPFLARTPGFAMSVLATAAIVVVAPRWTERLSAVLPGPVAAAVAVPAAAQLACTPVIVAAFGQLSPLAIPANLLAAPAVAPATLLGIGCAVLAVAVPWLSAWLAWPAAVPVWWLAVVARTLGRAPGAAVCWPTGWWGIALLAAALGVLLVLRRGLRGVRRRAILGRCPR